ncbi:MAG TPA: TetR family transcriptional regulator, partial [Algoriphagus sp.]|nr:TetR family transcriptional regulator [Algoriphagus sp.]
VKINPENWEPGFIKLMQEMLKGTIQASKPTTVQTSLF